MARRLLVFGIDGLRTDEFEDNNETPNIDSLGGLYCPAARIKAHGDGDTTSGPGWSTILTGTWHDKHNVTVWDSFAGSDFTTYPDFLKRIKAANSALRVVSFSASWTGIGTIVDGVDLETFQEQLGGDLGDLDTDTSITTQLLTEIAANDPDVIYCYTHACDGEGHDHNWQSAEQRAAIVNSDTQLGRILDALSTDDDWMVIVCTDHGGGGGTANNHLNQHTYPCTAFVPLIVSTLQGGTFQRFPGAYLVDIAPTALAWMGVDIPAALDGVDLLSRWHDLPPRDW